MKPVFHIYYRRRKADFFCDAEKVLEKVSGVRSANGERHRKLLERMKTARPSKECRELHKELKEYGDGMLFTDRYPNCSTWLSVAAFSVAIIVSILQMLEIGN